MMTLTEIERLSRELLDDAAHGIPLDTFKLGLIARIAHEQIALVAMEARP